MDDGEQRSEEMKEVREVWVRRGGASRMEFSRSLVGLMALAKGCGWCGGERGSLAWLAWVWAREVSEIAWRLLCASTAHRETSRYSVHTEQNETGSLEAHPKPVVA